MNTRPQPPLRNTVAAVVVALAALVAPLSGCAAGATFHSKTGVAYPQMVDRAVRCDEREIDAVLATGGLPIGTISAKAFAVDATADDLFEKALRVAARSGGTHVALTERGIESFTVLEPGRVEKRCAHNGNVVDCQTTLTPPTQTTHVKPTAQYIVFRVPPERWTALPPALQPAVAP